MSDTCGTLWVTDRDFKSAYSLLLVLLTIAFVCYGLWKSVTLV
jgi:hypothetical protein